MLLGRKPFHPSKNKFWGDEKMESEMKKNHFGQQGPLVTVVGLGGEGVLRTFGRTEDAGAVIREALDQGMTYFDSARVYAGSEGYYGSIWPEHPEWRERVFQASKSASRDRKGAMRDLEHTFVTMGIDYLDLWQIHDVRTEAELEMIAGPGGALEAFLEAKEAGKVRHIGVTGHHDPAVLTRAVQEWPVDSVMMPVNPTERSLEGFHDTTLSAARRKGIAVIGMKVLGASHYVRPRNGITAELLVRYALSQGITTAIVGCSSPEEVRTLARIGREWEPLPEKEQEALVAAFEPFAKRLAFYRP